ncbi:hypothetical protein PAXRUDRAFT_162223 [Paxillus rubicundulus Ve08.2h10]|uniref:Uncharacterized protein n=1 Tax=Paxillus rubicundulus Ve08.2h10 TaxID=930991 RepID=A0A0D0DL99_9AGAM|nr:hypothetical protein PAXRUDRAFT_162223 [Paxillus rubicundulus Ve08.2h10]
MNHTHLNIKRVIHPLFADLCRIERSLEKGQQAIALGNVKELANREPYEVTEDGHTIWHPKWLSSVDDTINTKFIREVTDKVWNNEKQHKNPNTNGEINDEDYHQHLILKCAKNYFRNIHKQVTGHTNPDKMAKAEEHLVNSCHHSQCSGVSKNHRKVATWFKAETKAKAKALGQDSGLELGALALIDTDFCKDAVFHDDDKLSDSLQERRQKAELSKDVNIAIRYEWRSIDYVTFLCFLSLKAAKLAPHAQPANGQPATKKRRTTTNKLTKKTFDAPSSMMSKKEPSSGKKPPTIPLKSMVDLRWTEEHPKVQLMDGADWLVGFYNCLDKAQDLLEEDAVYLKELIGWKGRAALTDGDADDEEERN